MKRISRNSIAFLLLVVLLCASQPAFNKASEGEIPLLNELCKPVYEGRRIGTEGNRQAAELLAKSLKTCALFPLEGYPNYLVPFEQGIAVINETSLVAVMEDGSREELVYGKDYMITSTASTVNGTFPVSLQAEKADSSAVLLIDPTVEKLPQSGSFAIMVFPVDTLPFNSLGIADADFSSTPNAGLPSINMLRSVYERISKAVSLEIQYNFSRAMTTLHNVVGVLPGEDRTKAVVLSAHFDGAGDQAGNRLPCALDNASGVAAVDLVLSQMTGAEPPYDMVFAFTNAEEAGLTGAYDLSEKLTIQYEALYNINVDCIGLAGLPFPLQSSHEISSVLCTKMENCLTQNGFSTVDKQYGGSDHNAFELTGIPSVVIGTVGEGIIHTANDSTNNIDHGIIRDVANLIVGFIMENPDIHIELAESCLTEADEYGAAEIPALAYNEFLLKDDTMYAGSQQWLTYEEALRYHPSLPLPRAFKGCPLQACMVSLSPSALTDIIPGIAVSIPDVSQNISMIKALYSDGTVEYSLQFNVYQMRDQYRKHSIGSAGYLLKEQDSNIIQGIGLQKGDYSLYLCDSNASDDLWEIQKGLSVYQSEYNTSKVTEENAAGLLADSELTGLFDALIEFVQPHPAS